MNRTDFTELVTSILKEHNLEVKFEISSRMKTTYGLCVYDRRTKDITMRFNKYYIENGNDEEIRDTVLHELAHAIDYKETGSSSHGANWKMICKRIGAKPERTLSSQIAYQEGKKPTHKWIGTCPNCGKQIKRHKRKDISCGICDKAYNPKYKIVYTLNEEE